MTLANRIKNFLAILWARWFCKEMLLSDRCFLLPDREMETRTGGPVRLVCVGWHCKGCPKGNK